MDRRQFLFLTGSGLIGAVSGEAREPYEPMFQNLEPFIVYFLAFREELPEKDEFIQSVETQIKTLHKPSDIDFWYPTFMENNVADDAYARRHLDFQSGGSTCVTEMVSRLDTAIEEGRLEGGKKREVYERGFIDLLYLGTKKRHLVEQGKEIMGEWRPERIAEKYSTYDPGSFAMIKSVELLMSPHLKKYVLRFEGD